MRWMWTLYNDGKEESVIENISIDNEMILNRCLEFLKTEIEFPIKSLSSEEASVVKRKWGVEWRTDCTCPNDFDTWPFPKSTGSGGETP